MAKFQLAYPSLMSQYGCINRGRFKFYLTAMGAFAILTACQQEKSIRRECENSLEAWQSKIAGAVSVDQAAEAMSEIKKSNIDACENAGGWEPYRKRLSAGIVADSQDGVHASISTVNNLKAGHKKTCVPTIARQMESVTGSYNLEGVTLFCECLGNLYFNDISASDVGEIAKGNIPTSIAMHRKEYQSYCADLHLKN